MDHEPSIDDSKSVQISKERRDAGLSTCCGLKIIEELGKVSMGNFGGKQGGILKMKICAGCANPQAAMMLFGTKMFSFARMEMKPNS